ncbi:MAG: hypothetical protein HQL41_07010 [Alphaproteobacteria bacterium]|nr:hypothetical protein [Alphaproteobacteria bacterium]
MTGFIPERVLLRLDLLEDTIASASNATAGQHACLSLLRGTLLLGVAARGYAGFGEAAWDVFHAGSVRFGNAYPILDGTMTVPVPASWYGRKNAPDLRDARDLSRETPAKGERLARIGDKWIADDGGFGTPVQVYRRKTAIDRVNGRARESALFGYVALAAGQSFWSEILFAPTLADEARRRVLDQMTADTVFLGRSRGAEFGETRISVVKDLAPPLPPGGGVVEAGRERVRLYLLSDVAMIDDATGLPAHTPRPEQFGLPAEWELDDERTFLHRGAWSPFNAFRRSFDPERQVWRLGGVVTFTGRALTRDEARDCMDSLADGVGLYRHDGLGRVVAEPWCLERIPRPAALAVAAPASAVVPAERPSGTLITWLERRHDERRLTIDAERLAAGFEEALIALYRRLWREADQAGRRRADITPSRAQWGGVRDIAAGTEPARLDHALFDGEEGYCASGVGGRSWRSAYPWNPLTRAIGQPTSCADLLRSLVGCRDLGPELNRLLPSAPDLRPRLARLALASLADRMPRRIAALEREMRT